MTPSTDKHLWLDELIYNYSIHRPNKGMNRQFRSAIIRRLELAEVDAALNERKDIALDNYNGHTFSDSTNWEGKYQKFIDNNQRRLAKLQQRRDDLEGRKTE